MDAEELESVLETVRDLVRDRVIPAESQIDETDEMPPGLRAEAARMGLFGFAIPEEYGGLGLTMVQESRLVMELGYTTPAFRSMFGTNNGIAGHVVMEGGSAEQRKEWLPKLASGEWTASFALTEAEAGSDPSRLTTTARSTDTGFLLSGDKRYITNAPVADVFMVFARHADGPAQGKVSVFLVPADRPGLTVGPKDAKMGQHGAWTAEVYLDNVAVDAAELVGDAGEGHRIAMRCLAHGRIHIAALCVGQAQRLLDETVNYALQRGQGGQVIAEYQLVQAMIADSQTEVQAGRALVLSASAEFDSGADRRLGPSCAKYFCSEMVSRVADRAVQVHGGAGYMRGVAVERMYRDSRLFRIYEGTSQIQQLVIARETLARARAQ
jgi:acyl-CoA dehydrogenase